MHICSNTTTRKGKRGNSFSMNSQEQPLSAVENCRSMTMNTTTTRKSNGDGTVGTSAPPPSSTVNRQAIDTDHLAGEPPTPPPLYTSRNCCAQRGSFVDSVHEEPPPYSIAPPSYSHGAKMPSLTSLAPPTSPPSLYKHQCSSSTGEPSSAVAVDQACYEDGVPPSQMGYSRAHARDQESPPPPLPPSYVHLGERSESNHAREAVAPSHAHLQQHQRRPLPPSSQEQQQRSPAEESEEGIDVYVDVDPEIDSYSTRTAIRLSLSSSSMYPRSLVNPSERDCGPHVSDADTTPPPPYEPEPEVELPAYSQPHQPPPPPYEGLPGSR